MRPHINYFVQRQVLPAFFNQIFVEHLVPVRLYITTGAGHPAQCLTLKYADAPHGCGISAQYYWLYSSSGDTPKRPADSQSPWLNIACQDRQDLELAITHFLETILENEHYIEARIVAGKIAPLNLRILHGDSEGGYLENLELLIGI